MGHTSRCENATGSTCRCSCDRRRHGIATTGSLLPGRNARSRLSRAVTAAADKLAQIVTTSLNFATGHEQALFLLRLAAMATCPNPDQHPSLERTCANPVISGIATDAAKVQLRSA